MSPRHRRLAVRAATDPVLHHVAPMGLAAGAGMPALLVDLDPGAPGYPGRSLAELAEDGPRRADLAPRRDGVAVLSHGGIDEEAAAELLPRLTASWPAVVFRVPDDRWDATPLVPVHPLLPPPLDPPVTRPAAFQSYLPGANAPAPGIVLPPPGRTRVVRMLGGVIEPRSRWVRAWARAWELPWR